LAGPAVRGLFAGVGGGFTSWKIWNDIQEASYIAPEIMFEAGVKYELSKFGLVNFFAEASVGAKNPLGDSWTYKDKDGNKFSGGTKPADTPNPFYYGIGFGYFF